jgi:hypothetical protein
MRNLVECGGRWVFWTVGHSRSRQETWPKALWLSHDRLDMATIKVHNLTTEFGLFLVSTDQTRNDIMPY